MKSILINYSEFCKDVYTEAQKPNKALIFMEGALLTLTYLALFFSKDLLVEFEGLKENGKNETFLSPDSIIV